MEVIMKRTALAAAVALALSGALLAGCDKDGNRPASGGGSSASGSASPSGSGGTSGQAPSGGASGQAPSGGASGSQSDAPKKPSSPSTPGGSK
jgi:hypothetical protein